MKTSKTTKVEHEITSDRDDLVDSLSTVLNKEFKELGKIAFNLDEDDDPSTVTDWVSTGSSLLDLAISNRPNGGFPASRIIEVNGTEASGKSLLAAHALANTQKKGGVAVLIDTESALSKEFLSAIGVDNKKLMYVSLETVEDIFQTIETIICTVRKTNKNRLVTIVVDSLAAATTKDEKEDDYDLTGFATKKAIILSKAFRKITNLIAKQNICLIFTNQLREKVGVMTIGSLNKFIAPGGKALGFYASVRVRLEAVGQIKNSDKETIGIATKATVYKNRLGPPYKKALFNIFFDRGVSDYDSWIDWMVERKLLKNAKTPKEEEGKKPAKKDEGEKIKLFAFELSNGETVTFERKTFASTLESNQLFKDEIYKCMCDNFIMKYRNELGEVTVDDIEVEDTES